MGTFLTGPLLRASSPSVPSIFHLPSVSQESPGDAWVCLSWLLRAKCLCLNRESRFLRVFLSVGFYEPWEHDSCVCVLRLNPPCGLQPQIRSEGVGVGVCRQLFVMSSGQFTVRPWFVCYAGSFSLFAPLSMWPFHSHGSKLQGCINSLRSPLKRGVHPTLFMMSSIPAALLCKLRRFRGNISVQLVHLKAQVQSVSAGLSAEGLRHQAAPFLLWQKHRAAAACCHKKPKKNTKKRKKRRLRQNRWI